MTTLADFNVDLIRAAWSRGTSALPEEWSPANPARGQCAVTALVLQDAIGGKLVRAKVNGEPHYWNLLDDGTELDLTLRQFGKDPVVEPPVEERDREYVLSFPDTMTRYFTLLQRINSASIILWLGRPE